jgi:hypothetical protein
MNLQASVTAYSGVGARGTGDNGAQPEVPSRDNSKKGGALDERAGSLAGARDNRVYSATLKAGNIRVYLKGAPEEGSEMEHISAPTCRSVDIVLM